MTEGAAEAIDCIVIVPRSIPPVFRLLLAAAGVSVLLTPAHGAPPLPPLPTGPAPAPKPGPAAPAAPGTDTSNENVVKAETPKPEVTASALAAVQKYGTDIVAGRFPEVVGRMYLPYKERMAKRAGSVEEFDRQLQEAMAKIQSAGVTTLSLKIQSDPQIFEVTLGKKTEIVDGKPAEIMVYTKWLVLVPIVTRFQAVNKGEKHLVDRTSYLVAISDKGKNDWSFMDGASSSMVDLRGMFPTLPDLKLPPLGAKEIPAGQ